MFHLINIKHELSGKNHSDFQYNGSGGENTTPERDNIHDHT